MNAQVLVLGGVGLLGSAVVAGLQGKDGVNVTATSRSASTGAVPFVPFSVGTSDLDSIVSGYGPGDYVVNCIGVVKNRIDDRRVSDRLEATRVNSEFPHELASRAEQHGFRIIQIATDCIYSGRDGGYDESFIADPVDVYGATKSLGEVPNDLFVNVRCSIIGRQAGEPGGLVEWLLSQPQGATIQGYLDHQWNGVTTSVFGSLVGGLIDSRSDLSGTHHFVPADTINKSELSRLVLDHFDRQDVTVEPTVTGHWVDRTLATQHADVNRQLWSLAGFSTPPTIADMVSALP
ncbi:MAG: sugar nucleotide-binding protein [Pseudolysinimonas sp.]